VSAAKGFTVVCGSMDEALAVVDRLAPEHLEVQVADADAVWRRVRNFGGMFIGANTAEVFGDYGAGPNHVLPTSGTARYTGGLSVFTFLRVRTWLRSDAPVADRAGLDELARDSAALARLEGLFGHEAAALARASEGVRREADEARAKGV
jgi:phosphoribosyl-ATP pyrophosphohydrolase/phosphoribosyl-AMP cyclohydrolase/histidinol dehydrogenase